MNIEKLYICHYSKLVNRRDFLKKQLVSLNYDIEWVTEFDKDDLKKEDLEKIYPNIFEPMSYSGGRILKMTEISLALKHKYILEQVVKNNYQNVMIFEDDVLLCDNFPKVLNSYLDQLPLDYDFFWIGSCCDLHVTRTSSNIFVYEGIGSRCTHAYIISNKACKKILDYFSQISEPIDFFYNKAINNLKLKNYWAEPDIVSQNKNFKTSLNL